MNHCFLRALPGSKTVPSINLANKLAKKKPVKDPVVLLHPLSAVHVQLTPLPSPVPSPTPQYINSPVTQPASPVQPEPSCVKDEPMLVDETPQQKPEVLNQSRFFFPDIYIH